jgi:FkbM family methyltransferase
MDPDQATERHEQSARPGRRIVFVDVGVHRGQTLDVVLRLPWAFDHVYACEPDPNALAHLRDRFAGDIASGRLTLVPAGLSSTTGKANLYGGNDGGGASLFDGKTNIDATVMRPVDTLRATEFIRQIPRDDFVLMKLNCEGAECDILGDLIDSGEIERIGRLVVDFDIRKVRGRRGDARRTMRRLREAGFDRYDLAEDVLVGKTHEERFRNWLSYVPEAAVFCRDPNVLSGFRRRPKLRRRIRFWFRYI